jgi:hypothetical protein
MHSEGFPADYGLIAGMVIIREHGSVVVDKLMNEWWQYILEYCTRDELSFDYLCWKHNVKYSILPGDCCCNEYFINHKHFNESLVVGA